MARFRKLSKSETGPLYASFLCGRHTDDGLVTHCDVNEMET
jgi:hypothetical protein